MNQLSKSTCVRCKNCTQVIKTFPVYPSLEQVDEIKTYREKNHRVSIEENGNKPKCAGSICNEAIGREQLTLNLQTTQYDNQ